LPGELRSGLAAEGVPGPAAASIAAAPPVGLMFAAFLGSNPIASLLNSAGVLGQLPAAAVSTVTGRTYLPHLLSGPFHSGLIVVFILAAVLAAIGAVVSLFRGRVYIQDEHIHDEDIRVESDCA
jgi:hypothetical protein